MGPEMERAVFAATIYKLYWEEQEEVAKLMRQLQVSKSLAVHVTLKVYLKQHTSNNDKINRLNMIL